MSVSKRKKQDILPDEIKANLYDKIELIVDFHGITWLEVEKVQEKIKGILSPDIYGRCEEEFKEQELRDYKERHPISEASLRRYKNTETVIRYYSKDETEIVTISKLFLGITLNYEVAHKLQENISLITKIVKIFAEEEYFEIEDVYLIKRDSIYCQSLYRLYQCYEKEMFADASYLLQKSMKGIVSGSTSICNRLKYQDYDISIVKSVVKGYTSSDEEIYEGKMDTIVSYEVIGEEINIKETLMELNNISYKIFMSHITNNFANELLFGKTNKVKNGVNLNE